MIPCEATLAESDVDAALVAGIGVAVGVSVGVGTSSSIVIWYHLSEPSCPPFRHLDRFGKKLHGSGLVSLQCVFDPGDALMCPAGILLHPTFGRQHKMIPMPAVSGSLRSGWLT